MSKLGRDKAYFKEIKVDLASNLKSRIDLGFNNVLNTRYYFFKSEKALFLALSRNSLGVFPTIFLKVFEKY